MLQLQLTLSALCADYEYARSLGKMCSDSCPRSLSTALPCTGGKPTHAFLFLHSPRASKSLFCVLLIFSWPRICFHLRFSIAASIVLKPPCARTSSIPLPSSMWPKTTRGFRFSRDVGKRGKKRNRNTIEKSKKRQRRRRTQRLGIRATLSRTPEH